MTTMNDTWFESEPDELLVEEVGCLIDKHGVNQVLGAFLVSLDYLSGDIGNSLNHPVDAKNCETLRNILTNVLEFANPPIKELSENEE